MENEIEDRGTPVQVYLGHYAKLIMERIDLGVSPVLVEHEAGHRELKTKILTHLHSCHEPEYRHIEFFKLESDIMLYYQRLPFMPGATEQQKEKAWSEATQVMVHVKSMVSDYRTQALKLLGLY